jgi:hypothetical protein
MPKLGYRVVSACGALGYGYPKETLEAALNGRVDAFKSVGIAVAAALTLGSSLIAAPAEAAGGCGPGAWRGPWGHCRDTPYYGRLPNGQWKFKHAGMGNGCPPGHWRGPWGHCRNTPYHGRRPGGGWK